MLRDSRLVGLDNGLIRYLAAVVSICEYTVSNKGGLPCHCHDCGRLWGLCPHALYFVGATAPTAPPPLPHGSAAYEEFYVRYTDYGMQCSIHATPF